MKRFYQTTLGKYILFLNEAYPFPVKVFRVLLTCLAIIFGLLIIMYLLIAAGVFGVAPSKKSLREVKNYTASEVYSQDSVLLGKYFIENRTNATYEDLPDHLVHALVATEDARFYEHKGIDFTSFGRVLVYTILLNDDAGGGSTISQQLAKNLYGRKDFGPFTVFVNKFREIIIAHRLESVYSKEEILTLYLNTFPCKYCCLNGVIINVLNTSF